MIYADRFAYRTALKTVESAPDRDEQREFTDVLVGFIHLERADEEDPGRVETKLVKNLKWAARKNGTKRILLHSFVHLAETKASPALAREVLAGAQRRLLEAGYQADQTPFGYFLDLTLVAPGCPSARIFQAL